MNLFDKAKNKKTTKSCLSCNKEFTPDKRNVNRGWGLCCSELRINKLEQLGI